MHYNFKNKKAIADIKFYMLQHLISFILKKYTVDIILEDFDFIDNKPKVI